MQNQNNNETKKLLTLSIITPDKPVITVSCDSVHLTTKDDTKGKGGGLYGIRVGHANSVLALKKGETVAYLDGEEKLRIECDEGFAKIENNNIKVISEKI